MKPHVRELMRDLAVALVVGVTLALAAPQAFAGMIVPPDGERDRVKAMLERPELAAELRKRGIAPDEARARVDAMTPSEVAQTARQLDTLAAGGQSPTRDVLLVILVVLLVLLLV
jgi:hypothetical protein